jgi:hypothetical protein
MPAPSCNTNAMKHGLMAGKLPPGCSYIRTAVGKLQAALQAATLQVHGELDVYRLALIHSAMRWERHALLAQKWLRDNAGTMNAADRLAYSRDVARASSERDRCLKLLGLDRSKQDAWIDALYSDAPATGETLPTDESPEPDADASGPQPCGAASTDPNPEPIEGSILP